MARPRKGRGFSAKVFFWLLLCPPNDRTEQKAKSRVIREQKQLARTEEKEESRKKDRKKDQLRKLFKWRL